LVLSSGATILLRDYDKNIIATVDDKDEIYVVMDILIYKDKWFLFTERKSPSVYVYDESEVCKVAETDLVPGAARNV
jgi:hypothetical protein